MQKYGRGKLEQYYTAIKIHLTKFLFRRRSFLKESEEPSIKWIATYDGSHESAFKDNSKPGRLWREKLKTLQATWNVKSQTRSVRNTPFFSTTAPLGTWTRGGRSTIESWKFDLFPQRLISAFRRVLRLHPHWLREHWVRIQRNDWCRGVGLRRPNRWLLSGEPRAFWSRRGYF